MITTTTLPEHTLDLLAATFAGVLRGWLTDEEWDAMRQRNAERPEGQSWCASHDYCDANMAMDAAFKLNGIPDIDASSEADCANWNAAWAIADTRYLTGATAS